MPNALTTTHESTDRVYDQMRTLHRADPMRVECPESLAPETKLFCSPTVIDDRIVVQ